MTWGVLLGVVLVCAPAVSLQAQEAKTMLAMPPTPLLPEALRTGPDHDAGNGVPSWVGADGPVLMEDGIKRFERGTAESHVAHGTVPSGTVTVYQFDDATGAYAAYSYLRRNGADACDAERCFGGGVEPEALSGVGCGAVEDGADRSAEGGWNERDCLRCCRRICRRRGCSEIR